MAEQEFTDKQAIGALKSLEFEFRALGHVRDIIERGEKARLLLAGFEKHKASLEETIKGLGAKHAMAVTEILGKEKSLKASVARVEEQVKAEIKKVHLTTDGVKSELEDSRSELANFRQEADIRKKTLTIEIQSLEKRRDELQGEFDKFVKKFSA